MGERPPTHVPVLVVTPPDGGSGGRHWVVPAPPHSAGGSAGGGGVLRTHRAVLAARCAFMRALFTSGLAESRRAAGAVAQQGCANAARYHLIEAPEGSLDCGGQREWPLALVSTPHRTHATHPYNRQRPANAARAVTRRRRAALPAADGGRSRARHEEHSDGPVRNGTARRPAGHRTLAHQRLRGAGAVADVCAVASVGDVPAWRARGRASRCHRMLHPVPPPPLPTSAHMRYEHHQLRVQSCENDECAVQHSYRHPHGR